MIKDDIHQVSLEWIFKKHKLESFFVVVFKQHNELVFKEGDISSDFQILKITLVEKC